MAESRARPLMTDVEKQQAGHAARDPPSRKWRIYHATCFFIGASFFLTASPMFYPVAYSRPGADFAAAWLWIVGSASFLVADLTEWWFLRKGHENGMENYTFLCSVIGSLLYLVGSCLFLPIWINFYWGSIIFIAGSAVIVVSQAAKLGHALVVDFFDDIPAAVTDSTTLFGAFWYLISSTCGVGATGFCSPQIVATMYTLGGLGFTMASVSMQYRYFFSTTMPKPTGPTSFGPLFSGSY